MNAMSHFGKTCCCSLLLMANNTHPVITLRTLPGQSVRIQVAWDTTRDRANVAGNQSDEPRLFTASPTFARESAEIKEPFVMNVPEDKQIFLAIAGYCNGERISRTKQIVLPVEDGADLIIEDNGKGDISAIPQPEIKLINGTKKQLSVTLFLTQLAKSTQCNSKTPWHHELTTQEIILSSQDASSNQTHSFAPKFIFWDKEEPVLLSIIKTVAGKANPVSIPLSCLYPLCGQQTIIEFLTKPKRYKAFLISAAGILASLVPPQEFNKESDGPFIMVHRGVPLLQSTPHE